MPTKRRIYRVAKALHQRQPDLMIALDNVHDAHNLSAVMRTADATGIGKIIWRPDVKKPDKLNPEVSLGTERWVNLEVVEDLPNRLSQLRKQGYKVAVTHMASKAVDFRTIDWTKPWVLVMGNEQRGCTDEVLEVADENVFIPMAGFVQSLNISVAAAVIMFEIQRQRQAAGMYSKTRPAEEVQQLYDQWKLADAFFDLNDLLEFPRGPEPEPEFPLNDGRSVRKFVPENERN